MHSLFMIGVPCLLVLVVAHLLCFIKPKVNAAFYKGILEHFMLKVACFVGKSVLKFASCLLLSHPEIMTSKLSCSMLYHNKAN